MKVSSVWEAPAPAAPARQASPARTAPRCAHVALQRKPGEAREGSKLATTAAPHYLPSLNPDRVRGGAGRYLAGEEAVVATTPSLAPAIVRFIELWPTYLTIDALGALDRMAVPEAE